MKHGLGTLGRRSFSGAKEWLDAFRLFFFIFFPFGSYGKLHTAAEKVREREEGVLEVVYGCGAIDKRAVI
jgi:hypothetical protein